MYLSPCKHRGGQVQRDTQALGLRLEFESGPAASLTSDCSCLTPDHHMRHGAPPTHTSLSLLNIRQVKHRRLLPTEPGCMDRDPHLSPTSVPHELQVRDTHLSLKDRRGVASLLVWAPEVATLCFDSVSFASGTDASLSDLVIDYLPCSSHQIRNLEFKILLLKGCFRTRAMLLLPHPVVSFSTILFLRSVPGR